MSRDGCSYEVLPRIGGLTVARICIVTPNPLGSNPRVVKEADALAEAGHQVCVVSTRNSEVVESRDEAVLKDAGWESLRIDLRDRGRRLPLRLLKIAARGLHRVTGSWRAQAQAHSIFPVALASALRKRQADLYIAHYVAALPVVGQAARRTGARYAYDAEDFHPGDLPDTPAYAYENGLIRRIEARWLPGCAYVTAAAPGIARAYADAYGIEPPEVILNVFPPSQAPSEPAPRGVIEPGPSLYWFSQTIGPDRGLECAVDAISLATSKPHLYLRGVDWGGFSEALRDRARRRGSEQQLHFLPPGPPSQMERMAAGHDIGFVGETGVTPNRRIALTNKQFTYLLAGLPVLLSDTPAHRDFAKSAAGAAFLFKSDDPQDLARALDDILTSQPKLAAARARAFELGQTRFNWDIEKQKLIARVESGLTA
jgi:glycosyltransferase involved in cell wall biosynthesis